jgi:hypothetical protein
MSFVNFIKSVVAPSANEQLAKMDAHLLADIGVSTAYARANCVRMPADLGVRLV